MLISIQKKLAEIFWFQKVAFHMKTLIFKLKMKKKYMILYSHVKTDQILDAIIIKLKLMKKLKLKI